jgi:hypothetical protein
MSELSSRDRDLTACKAENTSYPSQYKNFGQIFFIFNKGIITYITRSKRLMDGNCSVDGIHPAYHMGSS